MRALIANTVIRNSRTVSIHKSRERGCCLPARSTIREVVQFAYVIELCISNNRSHQQKHSHLKSGQMFSGLSYLRPLHMCSNRDALLVHLYVSAGTKCLARGHADTSSALPSPRVVAYRLAPRVAGWLAVVVYGCLFGVCICDARARVMSVCVSASARRPA